MFLQILTASLIGSVFALVGGVLLLAKERLARSLSLLLVSFAVGSLMGAAFFDLIPERWRRRAEPVTFSFSSSWVFLFFLFLKNS